MTPIETLRKAAVDCDNAADKVNMRLAELDRDMEALRAVRDGHLASAMEHRRAAVRLEKEMAAQSDGDTHEAAARRQYIAYHVRVFTSDGIPLTTEHNTLALAYWAVIAHLEAVASGTVVHIEIDELHTGVNTVVYPRGSDRRGDRNGR